MAKGVSGDANMGGAGRRWKKAISSRSLATAGMALSTFPPAASIALPSSRNILLHILVWTSARGDFFLVIAGLHTATQHLAPHTARQNSYLRRGVACLLNILPGRFEPHSTRTVAFRYYCHLPHNLHVLFLRWKTLAPLRRTPPHDFSCTLNGCCAANGTDALFAYLTPTATL